jgi:hypothetical protein
MCEWLLNFTIGGCIVERDESTLVLSIDISPIFEEVFGHLQVVVASCQVEGGTVATLESKRKKGSL